MAEITRTVEYVLENHRLPSGNIASATESSSDELVQFCHGATGWIPLLCKLASLVSNEKDRYLPISVELGEIVWKRGLLVTKGPGICHGVAGSVCALVDVYRATQDKRWLFRAMQFCIYLRVNLNDLLMNADNPLSLFEGDVGALYAMALVRALVEGREDSVFNLMGSSCFPGLGMI